MLAISKGSTQSKKKKKGVHIYTECRCIKEKGGIVKFKCK